MGPALHGETLGSRPKGVGYSGPVITTEPNRRSLQRRGRGSCWCACRKALPCWSDGMSVFVDDAAEPVVAADVQAGDPVRSGDRCRDHAQRRGLTHGLVRTMLVVMKLELVRAYLHFIRLSDLRACRRFIAVDERQRNIETVYRYLNCFVTKDLDQLSVVVADDVEIYGSGAGVRGRHFVESAVLSPGVTVVDQEVIEVFAAEDRVVVSVANTYRRESTGVTAVQSGCKMYRLKDGKIVQFWGEQDLYGLLCGLEMLTPSPLEF
jgi:ketosteroid isomerase-like protein